MKCFLIHRNAKSMIPMEKRDSEKAGVAVVPTSATYLEACSEEWVEWVVVADLKDPRKGSLSFTLSKQH